MSGRVMVFLFRAVLPPTLLALRIEAKRRSILGGYTAHVHVVANVPMKPSWVASYKANVN